METMQLLGFGIPSGPELILIIVVLVLLFGAKKIPDLGRAVGSGIRNFKKGIRGDDDEGDGEAPKSIEGEKKPRMLKQDEGKTP